MSGALFNCFLFATLHYLSTSFYTATRDLTLE